MDLHFQKVNWKEYGYKNYCIRRHILSKTSIYQENANELEDLIWFEKARCVNYNFQKALSIDAINYEIINIDRRAHMFWRHYDYIKRLVHLSIHLQIVVMRRIKIYAKQNKGCKTLFAQKKQEWDFLELSFVDSLFWMLKIRHSYRNGENQKWN